MRAWWERDTDKCILFIFRPGSNLRYQFTLHTVLPLKHWAKSTFSKGMFQIASANRYQILHTHLIKNILLFLHFLEREREREGDRDL